MSETIGNYVEIDNPGDMESLVLCFSRSSIPLEQRWRNNGLSADFLGDYVTTFFPRIEDDPKTIARQAEIKSAVTYIANELLENAMKYTDETLAIPITITLQLDQDRIVFAETNAMKTQQAETFRAFIDRINEGDPSELYLAALENAGDSSHDGSGLGLITMMNDYGATLAWRIDPVSDDATAVTTQVCIEV